MQSDHAGGLAPARGRQRLFSKTRANERLPIHQIKKADTREKRAPPKLDYSNTVEYNETIGQNRGHLWPIKNTLIAPSTSPFK